VVCGESPTGARTRNQWVCARRKRLRQLTAHPARLMPSRRPTSSVTDANTFSGGTALAISVATPSGSVWLSLVTRLGDL
jgi:hypothetical protein